MTAQKREDLASATGLDYPVPDVREFLGGWWSFSRLLVGKGRPVATEQGQRGNAKRPALAEKDQGSKLWDEYWNAGRVPEIERARRIVRAIRKAGVAWCSEPIVLPVLHLYADFVGVISIFMQKGDPQERVPDALLVYQLVDSAAWVSAWTGVDDSQYMVLLYAPQTIMSLQGARDIFRWVCNEHADRNLVALLAEVFIRREAAKLVWLRAAQKPYGRRFKAAMDEWFAKPRHRTFRSDMWLEIAYAVGRSAEPEHVREFEFRNAIRSWVEQIMAGSTEELTLPQSLHGPNINVWTERPTITPRDTDKFRIERMNESNTRSPYVHIEPPGARRGLSRWPVIIPMGFPQPSLVLVGYVQSRRRLKAYALKEKINRKKAPRLSKLVRLSKGLPVYKKLSYRPWKKAARIIRSSGVP